MSIGIETEEKLNVTSPPDRDTGNHKMNVRSEDALEIISRKPDFLEKWAMILFLIVLLIVLIASWFIQYPDVVETTATLTANRAPKELVPLQQGRLVRLFVQNDDPVTENQVIGFIESTADHTEVIDLSRKIDSSIRLLAMGRTELVSKQFDKYYRRLGEVQTSYEEFISSWQQFNDYLVNGFYFQKRNMLKDDINYLGRINQTILKQKELSEQDVALAEESFEMNRLLANDRVISKQDFRQEKSQFLNKQLTIPQLNASILTNETQQRDKQKEINQIEHDIAQQSIIFEQAMQTLKSKVDDWIKKYVLAAPLPGKISFTVPLQENQFLQSGKVIGFVDPAGTAYYAETYLPQNNFGKIDIGQQVQLRFAAYPYEEYGYVQGTLKYISKVPSDSGFLAVIDLDKPLTTNYQHTIPFKNGLKADAIIITHNMRLLQRFYYGIVKSFSTNR